MWQISSVRSKSRQICDTRILIHDWFGTPWQLKINLQLWRFSRLFEFFAVRTFRITVEAYIRLEFVEHLCLAALVFIYLSIFIHVHCSSSIVHGIYYTCIYLHYTLLHELCFLCNILCILCDMIYIYIYK